MKKISLVLLALIIMLSSTISFASGVDVKSLSDDQLSALQSEVAAEIAQRNPQDSVSGNVGNCYVSVKGARQAKNRDGQDCIVITCEWSHTEDDSKDFMWTFTYNAFQDGIQLESSHDYTLVNDTADIQIKAGATLEVEFAYVLRNTASPVELEITELIAFTDTGKVEATFNLPL